MNGDLRMVIRVILFERWCELRAAVKRYLPIFEKNRGVHERLQRLDTQVVSSRNANGSAKQRRSCIG